MSHILYEHPLGYILLEAQEDTVLPTQYRRIDSYKAFKKVFSISGLLNYKDISEAKEEIEHIREGRVSKRLSELLSIHGVSKLAADKSYSSSLKELGILQVNEELSSELLRAVKKYSNQILETEEPQVKRVEVSLSHSVSRDKIKYSNRREDNSVMQCISLIDELSIDINDYFMRIREMYSWHFPELLSLCSSQEAYLEAIEVIGNRSNTNIVDVKELEKGEEIIAAINETIGGDISEEDMNSIRDIVEVLIEKISIKEKSVKHLEERMKEVAPNLSALLGNSVAARLILKAGGLSKLAMCPASTIQVLGAEKALFRAMKSQSKTPKYGILFHSSFINKCPQRMKGRISRYLSAKCAIASRIDCYAEEVTDAYGVAMRGMVEERAKGKSTHHMPTDEVLAKVSKSLA
ncbi:nucleolar protein 56 [Nematocida sp. LUAm3]|nr:nucleolar protein 56 [Nematocida sp. LUAm3]KAI5174908.1 nucleolar protein 56 [Nematocida sp. LUAm2]KAI5177494.1 nucleolar protein 56 [Nematocida sp. LUAm1]